MIPGTEYTKDPTVTVADDSEDCYLFVKFEELNSAPTYLTYTSTLTTAGGWTQGDGTKIPANVWYREVKASDSVKTWELLAGNTIAVKETVTNQNAEAAAQAKLVYTAYAVQMANMDDAADAWSKITA